MKLRHYCPGRIYISSFNSYVIVCIAAVVSAAPDDDDDIATVEDDIGKSRDGSRTDDEVVQR